MRTVVSLFLGLLLLPGIPGVLCAKTASTAHPSAEANQSDAPRSRQQLAKLEVLANLGDAKAQYQLGRSYLTGDGAEKDPRKAALWFTKAARKGDVISQRILATMYYNGIGVRKAPAHALRWFRKAAENGDAVAQMALADMYYRGIGLRRPNLKQAFHWMMRSAENGEALAQYRVGLMLRDGRGTRPNLSRAFLWLHVAALNAKDEGERLRITEERDKVGKAMSRYQLSETKQQSEKFARKYASNRLPAEG